MFKRKQICSAVLSTAFLVSMLSTAAFAAVLPEDIDIYHNGYNISDDNETIRLRKNNSIKLSYRIRPSDADEDTDVSWRSSDMDVVTVSSEGRVYAEGYGRAKVYIETENGVEDSCEIYVPRTWSYDYDDNYYYGGYYYYYDDDYYYDNGYYYYSDGYYYGDSYYTYRNRSSSSSSSSRTSSASSSTATNSASNTITLTERVPREVMLEGVRMGQNETYTLSNYASVSADSLQAAAKLGNGAVCFQTRTSDGKVVGALTIIPSDTVEITGNIDLGVYCGVGNTKSVQNTFDKYFTNKTAVVLCDQEVFELPVTVSANVGTLNSSNLHFYTYNTTANSYNLLTITGATRDSNGMVHFSTPVGGYIIISDGPLTLKSAVQTAGTGTTATTSASNTTSTQTQ